MSLFFNRAPWWRIVVSRNIITRTTRMATVHFSSGLTQAGSLHWQTKAEQSLGLKLRPASEQWNFYHEMFNLLLIYFQMKQQTHGKLNVWRTRKKSEPQMGFEPTTLRDLVGCCNHWATGDSMVSKGQFMGLDWSRITRLHSQVMTGTQKLTNSITLSH